MKESDKKQLTNLIATTGLTAAAFLATQKAYNAIFRRYNRPNYELTPGLICFERIKEKINRERLTFVSGKNKLNAYYYQINKPNGLVILVHGFRSAADEYLPITLYFLKNGFNVFTYDGTGTYESEGKYLVGFMQQLVDLDYALKYVENDSRFKGLPVFLLGHSCGGYAVNSILCKRKNVQAVASISAVNNCYTLAVDKGQQYGGELAIGGIPKTFLDVYQKKLFGAYTEFDSTKGINSAPIPIFVAHGLQDKVISFEAQSVISHRGEFINPNVKFYYGTGNQCGHYTIWHSSRANRYKEEVDNHLKSIAKDAVARKEYVSDVNHYLYSEINQELFDSIKEIFKNSLK